MLAGIFPKLNLELFPAHLSIISLVPSSAVPEPTLVLVAPAGFGGGCSLLSPSESLQKERNWPFER